MPHRSVSTETKSKQKAKQAEPRDTSNAQRGSLEHRDRAKVQEYLDRFAVAITSGDVSTIAALWETPAFVIDDRAAIPVSSIEEVEKFFAGAKDQYNAQGITKTNAEILDLDWVSNNLVVVRVRWPYQNDAGETLGAESSSYTLKRDNDGDFKMRVVLMRGVEESTTAKKRPKN
jgi:hypothetical protein